MNILSIGNSFSQDAQKNLFKMAKSAGLDITTVNLYIGGCSLEQHYRNMLSGEKLYDLEFNGASTGFKTSIEEALLSRKWDVVTLQQASHYSFDYSTYTPYIEELASFVRTVQPQAKIVIHETWGYEDGSERLKNVAGYKTHKAMYKDIAATYKKAKKAIKADAVIPAGKMFSALVEKGVKIHRDTFHASLSVGRYALSMLWLKTLCNIDITEIKYNETEEKLTSNEVALVKEVINNL